MAVVVSAPPVARADSSKTEIVTDTKRHEIVRQANMAAAAHAVADIIRTAFRQHREISQAIKNKCDIDILCDLYPDFLDVMCEILSKLVEDNHQHAGATDSQINILPISTIKGDRVRDACVICMESPAAGDVMRHLPCLHNFHKECIGTWLKRRNACPLCKSAIT